MGLIVGWWLGAESFSPHLLFGLPIVLAAVALQGIIHTRAAPAAPRADAVPQRAPGAGD